MVEKGKATTFTVSLKDSSGNFVTSPTLAEGDVKVSIDHTAFQNIGTLPSVAPTGSKSVMVTLSATETNCTNLVILFSDQAGAEWVELRIEIRPEVAVLDQKIGTTKTVKQVLGYCTTVLTGTISNAGNTKETYLFDGYTVEVTVDANGNRSAILYTDA